MCAAAAREVLLSAQIGNGGHERSMRSGTLNVPGIVAGSARPRSSAGSRWRPIPNGCEGLRDPA